MLTPPKERAILAGVARGLHSPPCAPLPAHAVPSRLARGPLLALANRAEFEAFCARACAHVRALARGIDRAYGRLERGQDCAGILEAMETEREEILLRVDEAFAMLEYQQDACFGADGDYYGAIYEPNLNRDAPLPYGWKR